MYCEKCQSNVLTKREDIDIGIIILLFIFTAGFGILIYLIVYHDKKPNRCIHCNSVCKPILIEEKTTSIDEQSKNTNNVDRNYILESKLSEDSRFCYNCGTELDSRERNFCPFCGVNVE
jgi:hypothetical protein